MLPRVLASATLKPLVLSVLRDGPSYGYRIIQRIEELSDGEMQWTTGTLYPFLHGLENEGLVEAYWQAVENAPRRKYYRLTDAGAQALAFEKRQWLKAHRILAELWGPAPDLTWS